MRLNIKTKVNIDDEWTVLDTIEIDSDRYYYIGSYYRIDLNRLGIKNYSEITLEIDYFEEPKSNANVILPFISIPWYYGEIPQLRSTTTDKLPYLNAYNKGLSVFDETLGKPVWWNGINWVDATGNII